MEGPGLIFEGFGRHIWNHDHQERPKTCKNKNSITRWPDRQRVGGAAVVPPGGFNPPPTEGVQGVLNWNYIAVNQSSRSITNGQAPDGKLKFLDQGSYTPLFFSPQEPGDHRRPCAKKRKNGTLWLFFSNFCPSKLQSKFCIEKSSKKV